MNEEGGCLEAQVDKTIAIEAYLDAGQLASQLEADQGIKAKVEEKMEITATLGRCVQE